MPKVSKENLTHYTQLSSFVFNCQSSTLKVLVCSINVIHSMHRYPNARWCRRGNLDDPSIPFLPALCSLVQPFEGKRCHPQIHTLALCNGYANLGLGSMHLLSLGTTFPQFTTDLSREPEGPWAQRAWPQLRPHLWGERYH